ncbi:MAG: hypothetical protein KatS3mg057_0915 [Herpetosiphonaceae bacterium]|nr:MAG: hypothetical protein KatS3mg057_0915 [Herpetosiphonaceae bacterium]
MAMIDRTGLRPEGTRAIHTEADPPHEVTLVEPTREAGFVDEHPERLIGDKAYASDPLDSTLAKLRLQPRNLFYRSTDEIDRLAYLLPINEVRATTRAWRIGSKGQLFALTPSGTFLATPGLTFIEEFIETMADELEHLARL